MQIEDHLRGGGSYGESCSSSGGHWLVGQFLGFDVGFPHWKTWFFTLHQKNHTCYFVTHQKLTWFFLLFQDTLCWTRHCPHVLTCSGNEDGEQVWVVNPKNKVTPRLWSADDKIVVIKDVWATSDSSAVPKKCVWLWKLNVDVPLVYHTFAVSWGGSLELRNTVSWCGSKAALQQHCCHVCFELCWRQLL